MTKRKPGAIVEWTEHYSWEARRFGRSEWECVVLHHTPINLQGGVVATIPFTGPMRGAMRAAAVLLKLYLITEGENDGNQ